MLRFMNAANAITLVGALCGLASAVLAVQGHLAYAFGVLILCGICDVFDGFVARKLKRTEEEKTFGGRLDSLVDATSFGLTPPLVLYGAGLQTVPELGLLALYLCCAVWRLAYFDTMGLVPQTEDEEGKARRYYGLPTTFCALAIPLAGVAGFYNEQALRALLWVTVPVLAFLMVGPIRFPKPRGVWYVIIPAGGIALLVAYAVLGGSHYPGAQPPLF